MLVFSHALKRTGAVLVLFCVGIPTLCVINTYEKLKRSEGMAHQRVFSSASTDADTEVEVIQKWLGLKPGMAYAEIGGGDGLFLAPVGAAVMPGGHIYGTGKNQAEIDAMLMSAERAGLAGSVTVTTGLPSSSGLPASCCDAIMLRMVYHMIKNHDAYLKDFRKALKPGGHLLLLEHSPDNGASGRLGATLTVHRGNRTGKMPVVPSTALLQEVLGAGFQVRMFEPYPFFVDDSHAYAVVLY